MFKNSKRKIASRHFLNVILKRNSPQTKNAPSPLLTKPYYAPDSASYFVLH